jgi:hypothetical protein
MKNGTEQDYIGVLVRFETIRLNEDEILVVRRECVIGIQNDPIRGEQDVDLVDTYVLSTANEERKLEERKACYNTLSWE